MRLVSWGAGWEGIKGVRGVESLGFRDLGGLGGIRDLGFRAFSVRLTVQGLDAGG